ncbi:dipeptide/oligopeptide/nickel ABC transporter ATP-binding protein [Vibrio hannami]|uniref:ABC transporter ATP-binding protein n=1 Tax=Vibrio hannami TaxID=2717094 RepID=UPI0024109191|nr:dipeptide/oligopeptide/nickel ABC transporter ATP-binding protein [Vibrio hannami]MDG3086391.1 dipeptide/oligopeptide/nickel ABC transporter ATP-binding protein [Vibrio hannami]
MTELVRVKKLNQSFLRNGERFHALKSVNISINEGECVGIVGASGSGKSTLARLLCQITTSDSGEILFQDKPLSDWKLAEYYQQVQMVFQDPFASFPARMTVKKYLLEPFINFKLIDKSQSEALAIELLERVHLPKDLLNRYPSQLSGGQLQRIAFARATALSPKLLICDEATSALDATIQKQVVRLFLELKQKFGFACLFITHDLALAEMLCDKIYVMHEGQVVEELTSGCIVDEATHEMTKKLVAANLSLSRSLR